MVGQFNIVLPQGDTYTEVVRWLDATGTPIDLTGYSGVLVVYDEQGTVLATFGAGTEAEVVLGGTDGTITFALQTAALPAGCHSYYLRLTSADGVVRTLLAGAFQLQNFGPCEVTG